MKTSQEIFRFFRVWGDGVEGGGAGEHGFYLRMFVLKQLLEVMYFLTQNAYNAVLQCWNKGRKEGMWNVGENQ